MKILKFQEYSVDKGELEIKVSLIVFKKISFLQIWLGWYNDKSWPYFQLSMGHGRFLDVFFYAYKVGFEFDILGANWGDIYGKCGLGDGEDT